MPADTYIFTEAGDKIGYGHYTRCKAIQNYIIDRNENCKLYLYSDIHNISQDNKQIVVNWMNQLDEIIEDIDRDSSIIVDSYLAGKEIYNKLLDNCKFLLAIDDYNRIVYPASLILNPNLNFDTIDYSNQKANVEGGPQYIILRSEILNNKSRYHIQKTVKNILITLGGSDYRNILTKIIKVFNKSKYKIHVVAGTEKYQTKIAYEHSNSSHSIYGHLSASEMASIMVQSDIVICGCGQTLHELSYLGIPSIGICIDKDQQPNMISYLNAGYLQKSLFWNQANLENEIRDLIGHMSDFETRFHISKTAKKINDGKGIERIYSLLN